MSEDEMENATAEERPISKEVFLDPLRDMTDQDYRRIAWLRVMDDLIYREIGEQLQFSTDRVRRAASGVSSENKRAQDYIQHLTRVIDLRSSYRDISTLIRTSWLLPDEPVSILAAVKKLIAHMPFEEVVELFNWLSKRHVDRYLVWFKKSGENQSQ